MSSDHEGGQSQPAASENETTDVQFPPYDRGISRQPLRPLEALAGFWLPTGGDGEVSEDDITKIKEWLVWNHQERERVTGDTSSPLDLLPDPADLLPRPDFRVREDYGATGLRLTSGPQILLGSLPRLDRDIVHKLSFGNPQLMPAWLRADIEYWLTGYPEYQQCLVANAQDPDPWLQFLTQIAPSNERNESNNADALISDDGDEAGQLKSKNVDGGCASGQACTSVSDVEPRQPSWALKALGFGEEILDLMKDLGEIQTRSMADAEVYQVFCQALTKAEVVARNSPLSRLPESRVSLAAEAFLEHLLTLRLRKTSNLFKVNLCGWIHRWFRAWRYMIRIAPVESEWHLLSCQLPPIGMRCLPTWTSEQVRLKYSRILDAWKRRNKPDFDRYISVSQAHCVFPSWETAGDWTRLLMWRDCLRLTNLSVEDWLAVNPNPEYDSDLEMADEESEEDGEVDEEDDEEFSEKEDGEKDDGDSDYVDEEDEDEEDEDEDEDEDEEDEDEDGDEDGEDGDEQDGDEEDEEEDDGTRMSMDSDRPQENFDSQRENFGECPLCGLEFTDEWDYVTLHCAHRFHLDCIHEWVWRSEENHGRCPECS